MTRIGRKPKIGGWHKTETEHVVDIIPRGEEDRHIADEQCECGPRLSRHIDGRVMLIHRTLDGREGFEVVGAARKAA